VNQPKPLPQIKGGWGLPLALLLIFAILAGFYSNARYGGWGLDGDALIQAVFAESIMVNHKLYTGASYSNGFAYGGLLAVAGQISGISPYQLVDWGNAWVAVIALVAFITYRELLSDGRLAVFSTLLLFLIPDFLFYVLRGGHERSTWLLALLMIFLLARSLRYARQPGPLLVHIVCFYLIFWAMAASNVYFASTFVNAIILSVLGAWLLGFIRWSRVKDRLQREHFLNRLLIVSLACLILVFVFINYTYRPALTFYYIAEDLVNRLGILLFGVQEQVVTSSYAYVGSAWINQVAYLALTGPQFLIATISFGGWAVGIWKQFSFDDRRWFLWWLYTAFGGLLVIGILSDFAGFLQNNMQLRMFTPFALFIAPLAALVLRSTFGTLSRRLPRFAMLLGGVCIVYGMLATMVKVTNEPLVANTWLFYAPGQQRVGQWMNAHIQKQIVWVDTWQQLPRALQFSDGALSNHSVRYLAGGRFEYPPYILLSENTRLRANRVGIVLPAVYEHNQIYDNGFVQLYYRRAITPYQR